MKVFESRSQRYGWQIFLMMSCVVATPAFAAKTNILPLAEASSCQSHAKAIYKKKVVEIEMASIAGDVTEMEVGNAREALQKRLGTEKENCVRMARVSASTGKSTGAL